MLSKSLLIVSIFFTLYFAGIDCNLPSSITACSRNLPNPEECIIRETNKLRQMLAVGDLGDGFKITPLEPLLIDIIHFKRGPEFSATFKNSLVNGPSNFIVEKLKADIPNLSFDFTISLPKLNFTGKYALKMRLLLLNIQGSGDIQGVLENTRGIVRLRGTTTPRDGKNYVKFTELTLKVAVGKGRFHLDNLFNGDPVLSELGNQFINENMDLFLEEMIPGFEKNLAKTFLETANSVLKDVTFDEMFPDI